MHLYFNQTTKQMKLLRYFIILLLSFILFCCGAIHQKSKIKHSNKRADEIGGDYQGQYKIGNPYKIKGITYYPEDFEMYEEYGRASWYGDQFHGKRTANGEIYNMGEMTAAHRTLPLPSIVRVTNLDNNKSVILRVSDRGPYAKNRVIDVSESAAVKLGFKNRGTANVKVEFLPEETKKLLAKIRR